MTANKNRTRKPKAVAILPTNGNNVPDLHRPFSTSWYRIVFSPIARPNIISEDPPQNPRRD